MIILEILAVLFNLLSAVLLRFNNRKGWTSGILACFCLFPIFYINEIPGQFILTFVFLSINLIGLTKWETNRKINNKYSYIVGVTILFTFIHLFDIKYLNLDYSILIISIIATILLMLKSRNAWYVFILVNTWSMILFFDEGLYLLVLLHFAYLINTLFALDEWKKLIIDGK